MSTSFPGYARALALLLCTLIAGCIPIGAKVSTQSLTPAFLEPFVAASGDALHAFDR